MTLVLLVDDEAVELTPEQSRAVIASFLPLRKAAKNWKTPLQEGCRVVVFGELGVAAAKYLALLAENDEWQTAEPGEATDESVISNCGAGTLDVTPFGRRTSRR